MTSQSDGPPSPEGGPPLYRCYACREELPRESFNRGKLPPDGRHGWCKACTARRHKEWRARDDNDERMRAGNRAWRLNTKVAALRHYGGVCACCGEDDVRFLTFDHIDGGGRKHLAEVHAKGRLVMWLRDNGYPSGFQVLCFSCNSGRAINGGVCPHQDPAGKVIC